MVRLITVKEKNKDFDEFLRQLREGGCSYEAVIADGKITRLYVRIPQRGDWSNVQFGRILGSKMVSYVEVVYLPRIVNGKFIYNYNEQKEK